MSLHRRKIIIKEFLCVDKFWYYRVYQEIPDFL
jgi:hypothetical protein